MSGDYTDVIRLCLGRAVAPRKLDVEVRTSPAHHYVKVIYKRCEYLNGGYYLVNMLPA